MTFSMEPICGTEESNCRLWNESNNLCAAGTV